MKYRSSFVTNSSSSSFICDVCGRNESGWDMCLSDAYMYECVNGHVICEDHIKGEIYTKEAAIKAVEDYIEKSKDAKVGSWNYNYLQEAKKKISTVDSWDEDDIHDILDDYAEIRYGIPEELCPVCNLSSILERDMLKYLIKKFDLDKKSVAEEMRNAFKTVSGLQGYIRG